MICPTCQTRHLEGYDHNCTQLAQLKLEIRATRNKFENLQKEYFSLTGMRYQWAEVRK